MDPLMCEWDVASFLIFSENVFAPLIYYSHLGPLIFSLFLGSAVLLNNPRALVNKVLFAVTAFFSIWVFFDLVLWASEKPEYIMFFWSAIVPVELLIYAASWYLVTIFANRGTDASLGHKLIVAATFLPIVFLAHTSYNLLGFDLTNCDREAIEGPLVQYLYLMELLYIAWITITAIRGYARMDDADERRQLVFVASGIILFLIVFTAGNILVSYFLEVDWSYEQYKLFGMPIFVALITYSSIKFKTFNLKVFTAQALVIALGILVFSVLFLRSITNVRIVVALTFILVCILGYVLIRNVRREIEQRVEIEKLAQDLESANKRLKVLDKLKSEFVSIASHQLRSPLTAIRGYASMLLEGGFGALPEKATEPISRIEESSRFMALSVDDFLNVSRIEAGQMKYDVSAFSLRETASAIADELRPAAVKKGLVLLFRSDAKTPMRVNADIGKVRQILQNLIDNAMKYTQKGSVTVVAHEDERGKKAYISVVDTGVGLSKETMEKLFDKFIRAKNASNVNVYGTGLGLYIARQMAEAMSGTITASSEGEGKGSTFRLELPLVG